MYEMVKNMISARAKRAQTDMGLLWGIIMLAAVIVVSGIFMAFGAQVTSDIQADFDANSLPYNITANSLEAQETLSEKQNTVALIGVIVIIIGLLMGVVTSVMMYMRYK